MAYLPPRFRRLLERDPRFRWEAYQFVQESLVYAQQELRMGKMRPTETATPAQGKEEETVDTHLTGQELCEALRRRAIDQFGYLAKSVLNCWGVRTTGDFGDIVYNLIDIECLRKSKGDRREDFDDVYEFDEVFRQDFRITFEE